jgi:hypothetical protein
MDLFHCTSLLTPSYSDPATFLDSKLPPPLPDSTNRSDYRDGANWVELLNEGAPLNISGWTLKKGEGRESSFVL